MVEKVTEEPTYSYEGVKDPRLRKFFEQSVEPAIQQVIGWPIRTSIVPMIFSNAFGLDRHQLFNIIYVAGREGVIDLVRKQEGEGNGVRYFLNQDGVRIIGALSWEFAERGGRRTLLTERISRVAEALGNHPLREKLHFSLLPLSHSQNNGRQDEVPKDHEEIVIARIERKTGERASLNGVPYIDEEELEKGRLWTLTELEELLHSLPAGWEQVNYGGIMQLVDGHPYTHARSLQIMFSSAACARNPRELRLFDPLLEDLNYNELRFGIMRCIAMLKVRPGIKNLTELFQKWVMRVRSRQQTAYDSSN